MKRLLLECAVVAAAVWGGWRWTHPPAAPPARTFAGARPDLDMPPAPALRPERPASAMDVVPEDARADRSARLGRTPALLAGPRAIAPEDAAAAPRPRATTWDERLRDPRALGVVFALFLAAYFLLTGALRRGPRGRGFGRD
jgi:hypothetical protein